MDPVAFAADVKTTNDARAGKLGVAHADVPGTEAGTLRGVGPTTNQNAQQKTAMTSAVGKAWCDEL